MKEQTKTTPLIYDFQNQNDKYYFAGLLNQADLNFRMALVELAKRCGIKHGLNKANEGDNNEKETISWIEDSFDDKLSETDWNHRTTLLSDFLPFVGEISNKMIDGKKVPVDRSIFRSELILLYKNLIALRNLYTHKHHDEVVLDKKFFGLLDKLLLQAAKTVRKRRLRNETYKPALPKQFEKDYLEAVASYVQHNAKIEELCRVEKLNAGFNLKQFQKKNPKYKKEDFHRIYLNRAMSEVLEKEKNTGELFLKDNQKSESTDKPGQLSQSGFIFFLSLFLPRKEAEDVLNHTHNFKAGYQLRYLAKRWTYTVFYYKGIRHTLRSEFSKEALLLQMVDELSKCPAELFDALPDNKQQEFIMDKNEYYKDNEENDGTPEESLVSHLVIRKRYQDRFPYLAVRFLDEFAGFQSLCFQLKLGKYNHDTRTKTFKGINTTTERSIRQEIKVFGKLSDVHKAKLEYFTNRAETDENPTKGWLQYPNVSYVLDNNNIPIYFNKFTEKQIPVIKNTAKDKSSKVDLIKILGFEESEICAEAPHAFLSTNELPALLYRFFEENKKKKKHPDADKQIGNNPIGQGVENQISGKIKKHYHFVQNIQQNECLSDKTIPKRLVKSLNENKTNGEIDFKKLTDAIKKQIEDCQQKRAWIDSKKEEQKNQIEKDRKSNRFTKKYWLLNTQEIGETASWLAKDIKRYVSKTNRKNWKGRHQAELQALLAFYDSKKQEVEILLKDEIGIIITKYAPLVAMFRKKTLVDAYYAYLTEKEELLKGYKLLIENNAENYNLKAIRKNIDEIFEHFDKSKYVYTDATYLSNLLQKPFNLPRGLFDDKNVFTSKGNKDERQSWFALAEDTPKQAFYMYPRAYRVKDENGKTKEIKNFDTHENINDKGDFDTDIKKQIVTNEKHIRKIARQDYYLLEMIKFLFEDLKIQVGGDITLCDAYLERNDIQRNINIARNQNNKQEGDCSENIYRISNLLEKRISIKLFGGKISLTDVALKDIGKHRSLEKDKRIFDLLSYPDRDYTAVTELINEIENYEYVRRHMIFKAIHKLEDIIYILAKKNNEIEKLEENGNPNFQKYIEYYYTKKGILFEKNNNPLIIIRNRFSHNQLPDSSEYGHIGTIVQRNKEELIGDYLLRILSDFSNALQIF